MRKVLAISLVLLVAIVAMAAIARAKEIERVVPMIDDPSRAVPTGRVFGLNAAGPDTFYYGGTVISGGDTLAAVPGASGWINRKMWSWSSVGFNGTGHSGLNMDGWKGQDFTVQAEDYFHVADTTADAEFGIRTCVLAGAKSLFCGVTNAQSQALCYVDQIGTGYGNNWSQTVVTKTYTFNIGDAITLNYKYHDESEMDFDFGYTILQIFDGAEWIDYDTLATYTGDVTGTEGVVVSNFMTPPVDFRIRFTFTSDGGYSDEDGNNPTACGGLEIDDYVLAWDGGPTDSENFEAVTSGELPAGWTHYYSGIGEFASVQHLNDLSVNLTQDPCIASIGPGWCEMADSVLTFFDPNGGTTGRWHPLHQNNGAISPVIDFSDHLGLPGRYLTCERFGNLPMAEYIFMQWAVRYQPGCESGGWSGWLSDNYVYYTAEGISCRPMAFDISTWVPPEALRAQVYYATLSLCAEEPWPVPPYPPCTNTDNVTPYFDNVSFGVFGSNVAPYVSMRELDYWQDQFAEDGTLDPLSTADTRTPNYLSTLTPPIFGDTLNCRTSADNAEIYFVFRMAKVSPLQPVTHDFFTTWFPGVAGGGWKEARMDTTETTAGTPPSVYTVVSPGRYMCTFHEADPRGLAEGTEILPNNLFIPGTRIEYFIKAKYTGGSGWFYLPDTTGGVFEEFEVLPMFRDDGAGGLEWPCLIVADHFGQRGNQFLRHSTRIGMHLAANGYEYDMYSKLGPTSGLLNGIGRRASNPGQVGGPGTPKFCASPGASLTQFLAYTHCMMNTGTQLNNCIDEPDVIMIKAWLTLYTGDFMRFFWLSGDQGPRWLYNQNPWGRSFLSNELATSYHASGYATHTLDYNYCLPINYVAGGRLNCTTQYRVRSNGCTRLYQIIAANVAAGGLNEKEFDAQLAPNQAYAVVTNLVGAGGANYKTVVEGYDNCVIRNDASLGYPNCGPETYMNTWYNQVFTWGEYFSATICNIGKVTVNPNTGGTPAIVTALQSAYPNPMNPTATIKYSVGTPGKVMLRVFDVSGRVIRTLVDQAQPTGSYAVIWDGSNDRGEKVASGVFFYQLNAPGYSGAKKIVILQ